MDVGLFLATTGPMLSGRDFAAMARAADERGFHSLWVAEHILFFDQFVSTPPFSERSALVAGEFGLFDPFAALAYVACATERIRLGTGIAIAPQRNPVQTAKLAATIDHLCEGRLDLGLGLGWVREEFAALDVPFAARGPRTDSYLRVMRALWEEDPSACETPHYRLPAARHWPKPVQRPLPVHIGGNGDRALRRAARCGNGWYAFNLAPEELAQHVGRLDIELERVGRVRKDLRISVCGYQKPVDPEAMRRYREAGADQLILFAMDVQPSNYEERLDGYAATFLEAARQL